MGTCLLYIPIINFETLRKLRRTFCNKKGFTNLPYDKKLQLGMRHLKYSMFIRVDLTTVQSKSTSSKQMNQTNKLESYFVLKNIIDIVLLSANLQSCNYLLYSYLLTKSL